MEDVRLGRDLDATVKQVATPASGTTAIVGNDPLRTRLVISGDGQTVCRVWPRGIIGTTGAGFVLSIANPILVITVEVWGKLATGQWFADDGANGSILTIAEMTLGKQ